MTSDLSEEEMRRALFGDAEPAPLVTPPPVPEATAELVFEKPKASLQKKKVAKAFTPRLQVTLMVGNEYEGKMFELIHQRVSEFLCNRLMSDTVAPNRRHHEQD
ncbi:hypothetical protein N0018_33330, partial [Pseudomonas aeruginosa]|nr:hypothetical protein [Pseudomonas aeruginosa]